jgi:DNA-binding IclR family transcriptional regulator
MSTEDENYIHSIQRAVSILDLFDNQVKYLGVSEIARHLDLNKSTVYRLVNTLKKEELLIQEEDSKKYRLGYKILDIANRMRNQVTHNDAALEEMKKLRDLTGEAVLLSVYTNIGGVCIEKIDTKNAIKVTSKPGHTTPLHCGATGKILLAYAEQDEINRVLKKDLESYTENSTTDQEKIREGLKEIRNQGYVLSWGEVDKGAIGIGAPILNEEGNLLYGLSLVGPEDRIKSNGLEKTINLVVNSADEISRKINMLEFA